MGAILILGAVVMSDGTLATLAALITPILLVLGMPIVMALTWPYGRKRHVSGTGREPRRTLAFWGATLGFGAGIVWGALLLALTYIAWDDPMGGLVLIAVAVMVLELAGLAIASIIVSLIVAKAWARHTSKRTAVSQGATTASRRSVQPPTEVRSHRERDYSVRR